jgi:signal transduction histidine kinase
VAGITHTMADITATDLHRRVPEPNSHDEIGELARTVNATLQRLDTAVEQQRRFVADASHELRGPLASLRADLEISITHPDHTDWTGVARETLGDVERLQRLTEDLLLLARLDAQPAPDREPIDLAAVVSETLTSLRRTNIAVTASRLDTPAFVRADASQLRQLVRNLLENAISHAETTVTVTVRSTPPDVELIVSDDGPGIPAEDRKRVFQRFVRLDTARTRDTGGTGLGLAIVHDVTTRSGGTINITDADSHGAVITVSLPSDVSSCARGRHVGRL